jgi:hypothetical protein
MKETMRIPETSSPVSDRGLVQNGGKKTKPSTPVTAPASDRSRTYSDGYSTPKSYTSEVDPQFYQRVCDSDDLWTRTQGAFALLMLWGVWLAGSFSAVWWSYLVVKGYYVAAVVAAVIMAYPYVVKVKQSPAFIRFILSGAGWFKGGTCLYLEESMKQIDTSEVRYV